MSILKKNLQLFDSVLELSILVNLQKKVLRKNLRFAKLSVLRRLRKKMRQKVQNLLHFMRKNLQINCLRENYANFAKKIWSFRGNPSLNRKR